MTKWITDKLGPKGAAVLLASSLSGLTVAGAGAWIYGRMHRPAAIRSISGNSISSVPPCTPTCGGGSQTPPPRVAAKSPTATPPPRPSTSRAAGVALPEPDPPAPEESRINLPPYSLVVTADDPIKDGDRLPLGDPRLGRMFFSVVYNRKGTPPREPLRVEWRLDGLDRYPFNFPAGDETYRAPHKYGNEVLRTGEFEVVLLVGGEAIASRKFAVVPAAKP